MVEVIRVPRGEGPLSLQMRVGEQVHLYEDLEIALVGGLFRGDVTFVEISDSNTRWNEMLLHAALVQMMCGEKLLMEAISAALSAEISQGCKEGPVSQQLERILDGFCQNHHRTEGG